MKKLSLFVPIALFMALLVGGCGMQDEAENPEGADSAAVTEEVAPPKKDFAVNVKTMTLQPESFEDVINVVGTVKPDEDIMVAAEEGGKVKSWKVQKGSFVKTGQALIGLNDDILQAQLKGAQAQLKIAKVNAEKSAKVYADAGAVSEVSVTTAQYNLDAAAANVELLETRIKKMTVSAPASGIIEERLVEVGEMVAPGAPIARLIQTGTVKITAGVPERYVDGLRKGLPVTITFDALDGLEVKGNITYVGAVVNQNDRSVTVEIELRNSGQYKPEMVANLTIVKDVMKNVMVIPRTALVRVENGYQVYLVVPDPKGEGYIAEARQVTLGPSDQGNIVIADGLKPGDRIITVGQGKINPGEHVEFGGE